MNDFHLASSQSQVSYESRLSSVEGQILWLAQNCSINDSELHTVKSFCISLTKRLRDFFPACETTVYGSMATGLAVRGNSDVDIFFDPGIPVINEEMSKGDCTQLKALIKKFRYGMSLLSDRPIVNVLNNLSQIRASTLVEILGGIVKFRVSGSTQLKVLSKIRCPLVHFRANTSGLECDITVTSRLGVVNTRLLILYQKLDQRVKPLMFVVRFWAKQKMLCENPVKLSPFTFSMLVLFYLQNCQPPVVPTVKTLQDLAGDSVEVVDGWPCQFCREETAVWKSKNNENVFDLLKGFFKYYSKFDWKSNVICLQNGKIIANDAFFPKSETGIQTRFKRKAINIQDPFIVTHNLALSVNEQFVNIFIGYLGEAYKIVHSPCMLKSDTGVWSLDALMKPRKKRNILDKIKNSFKPTNRKNGKNKLKTEKLLKNIDDRAVNNFKKIFSRGRDKTKKGPVQLKRKRPISDSGKACKKLAKKKKNSQVVGGT